MFRKFLNVFPLPGISSDHLCGIRVRLTSPEPSCITVLGVYLPCADQGMDAYCNTLLDLEHLISTSSRYGPVLIAVDFNAHLGPLGGPRGLDTPNQQGVLLQQLVDRCDLYVVPFPASVMARSIPSGIAKLEPQWTISLVVFKLHNLLNHVLHMMFHLLTLLIIFLSLQFLISR